MITVILQASNYKESMKNRNFQMIDGNPVIKFIINRLKKDAEVELVLAVSDREEDDIFEEIAKAEEIQIYRGSYDNILERLCGAANLCGAKDFVRAYANYPLIDIDEMKSLVKEHVEKKCDYSYNEHQQGVLWGTGCEVYNTKFICNLRKMKLQQNQIEMLGFYIRQNETKHNVLRYKVCDARPAYKVCLETEKDLDVVRELVENLENEINNNVIINYFEKHKLLANYNVEEPAKEVGIEKLFLHSEKVKNILEEQAVDTTYPISVELTLTNQCNLNCVYCSDNDLRTRQGRKQALPLETLAVFFEELSKGGTKGIVLEGGGEPTLYSEFPKVVRYAKENGLALGLITNGTVRLDKEVIREFEWIRVSLDASTAEEYMQLKGIDYFERVLMNIAYYSKFCTTVGVGYVVTNTNLSEIETLVMRVREAGVSYIQMRPVVDNRDLYPYGIDLSFLKFYQSANFAVIVDGMKENAEVGNGHLPCKAHSLTTIVSGDGAVYICGRLNIYDWMKPIGNINEQRFDDIWNGQIRKQQAEMISDGTFCGRNCPQCRITKFNHLVNRIEKISSKHFI